MTAARIQISDDTGKVRVADAMRSIPAGRTAVAAAQLIAADFEAGWTVRLWLDVSLVGPLDDLGEPDAVVTSTQGLSG